MEDFMKKIALMLISIGMLSSHTSIVYTSAPNSYSKHTRYAMVAGGLGLLGGAAYYGYNWYRTNISAVEERFTERERLLTQINEAVPQQHGDMRKLTSPAEQKANDATKITDNFSTLEKHRDSGVKFKETLARWKGYVSKGAPAGGPRPEAMEHTAVGASLGLYKAAQEALDAEHGIVTSRKWKFWGACAAGLSALGAGLYSYFKS